MDKKQARRLRELLAELHPGERNRLTRKAAKLRRAATRSAGAGAPAPALEDVLLGLLDDGAAPATPTGGAEATTDAGAAETAGAAAVEAEAAAGADPGTRGTVIGLAAGTCRVQTGGEVRDAVLPADIARRQQTLLAVGDAVLLQAHGEDLLRVTTVLPRRTVLTRADPHDRSRVRAIAANIDVVVVVVAAKDPPLHPRLIDRYLVAVDRSGARPVLAVNKIDLMSSDELQQAMALVQPYRALGMAVLPCSATTASGVEALREVLRESTCVFVGQSGVGKSSLLNALRGEAAARTGDVRAGDGRGRHTTTASALYELPGGVRVIDTPGIRRFTVDDADEATIAHGFTELAGFAQGCRYGDCTHTHEPDCAVKAAVLDGGIARSRYQSYRKLLGGDGDDPRWLEE
jgi:ribosome biogenesis GTPase / thiamine phosphate phosphatase